MCCVVLEVQLLVLRVNIVDGLHRYGNLELVTQSVISSLDLIWETYAFLLPYMWPILTSLLRIHNRSQNFGTLKALLLLLDKHFITM